MHSVGHAHAELHQAPSQHLACYQSPVQPKYLTCYAVHPGPISTDLEWLPCDDYCTLDHFLHLIAPKMIVVQGYLNRGSTDAQPTINWQNLRQNLEPW
jgi:hypothetical protein